MKFCFSLLLSLFITITSLSAQQIEIFGGINSNHLFESVSGDDTSLESSFDSGKGYTIGFSFDNPNMNGYASRITLSYNNIKGNISTTKFSGEDMGQRTNVVLEKNSVNLAVYPFTFIVQKIYLSFGLQANFTMSNSSIGKIEIFDGSSLLTADWKLNDPQFHKDISYGVAMRFHYNIMLNNGLSIIPQYNLYYGIGQEYETLEVEKIKSWQQVLAIGLGMQF